MKKCIAYYSPGGHTQSLALKLARRMELTHDQVIDLETEELPQDADVYIIGFGVRRNSCPMAVLEALDTLEGKKILCFATAALGTNDAYLTLLTNQLTAFLPEDASLAGIQLYLGALDENGKQYFTDQLSASGHPEILEKILKECADHPNESDADKLYQYIQANVEDEA